MATLVEINEAVPVRPAEISELTEAVRLARFWEEVSEYSVDDEGWIPIGNVGPLLVLASPRPELRKPSLPEWAYQPVRIAGDAVGGCRRNLEEARTITSGASLRFNPSYLRLDTPDIPASGQRSDLPVLSGDRAGGALVDTLFHWWFAVQDDATENGREKLAEIRGLLIQWVMDASVRVADVRNLVYESHEAFPPGVCVSYGVFPLAMREGVGWYAVAEPRMEIEDRLRDESPAVEFLSVLALGSDLADAIQLVDADAAGERVQLRSARRKPKTDEGDSETIALEFDSSRAASVDPGKLTTTTAEVLQYILNSALTAEVSDIHVQHSEGRGRIRFRMDGSLRDVLDMNHPQVRALIAVIKDMATGMAQNNYTAQDGAFTFRRTDKDQTVNVRVSAIPHLDAGQKLVLRLLPKRNKLVASLDSLEMAPLHEKSIKRAINRPQGIILVTGPTGSGKTTTLYNCLSATNRPEVSIQTIEDPCEIILEGINQTQVDEARGLTMNAAMRSVVRQDPDIILVGEIRDPETASLAVDAALTGHLVYSTLHSIDPIAALDRLLKLGESRGVTASMVAQSLLLIQAQRLVKTLCVHCRVKREILPEQAEIFRSKNLPVPETLFEPKPGGCSRCAGSGYSGRRAIMEILPATEEITREISTDARPWELRRMMEARGFPSMITDGLRLVAEGVTDLGQVMQYEAAWSILDDDGEASPEEGAAEQGEEG